MSRAQQEISSREFVEWIVFDRIESGRHPIQKKTPQTQDQMKSILKTFAVAHNGINNSKTRR